MAKMTIADLKNTVAGYVEASKQAGSWAESRENLYKLLDKVGLQITLKHNYNDRLPELDGNDLPLGKTIEEYFLDLTLPQNNISPVNAEDQNPENDEAVAIAALKPYLPTIGEVCYSRSLGKKVIPTSIPYANVERAAIDSNAAGEMIANITEKLTASQTLYTYACKKRLLGNFAEMAIKKQAELDGADVSLVSVVGPVDDTTTGEDFVKAVKAAVEEASFAHEGGLARGLIGATDEADLMLVVKKNTLPNLDMNVWAGAFHLDKASFPNIKVKVVEDFGGIENEGNIVGMLIDIRACKLHRGHYAVRTQENAYSEMVNVYSHSEYTGFISKYGFVKVFTKA